MADSINKVGLGVELTNGDTTLSQLRSIRFEMKAIIELGERIPRDLGSRFTRGIRERVRRESENVNKDQLELFQNYGEKQLGLFTQNELEKTRIAKGEENKRQQYRENIRNKERQQRQRDKEANKPRRSDYLRDDETTRAEKRAELNRRINEKGLAETKKRHKLETEGLQKVHDMNEAAERRHAKKMADITRNAREEERRRRQEFERQSQQVTRDVRTRAVDLIRSNAPLDLYGNAQARARFRGPQVDRSDATTAQWRTELARETRALRIAARERDRIELESEERQREATRKRIARERQEGRVVTKSREAQRGEIELRDMETLGQKKFDLNRRINQRMLGEDDYYETQLEKRRRDRDRKERDRNTAKVANIANRTQLEEGILEQELAKQQKKAFREGARRQIRESDLGSQFGVQTELTNLQRIRDRAASQHSRLGSGNFTQQQTLAARELSTVFSNLESRATKLFRELNSGNMDRSRAEIVKDLNFIEREFAEATEKARLFNATVNRARVSPSSIPPTPPGGLGPRGQLLNEKGFFTSAETTARITRNILLYEAVSRLSYGTALYTQEALEAAKASIELGRAIEFESKSAGASAQQNKDLADSLKQFGLSRQQGREAVVEATRFAEDTEKTNRLTNLAVNILASRGEDPTKTGEFIEQIRRRESKFFKRYFGKTVEEIYEDEGARIVDRRAANEFQTIGTPVKETFDSRRQKIAGVVQGLSDEQKEIVALNYVLSQYDKFAGQAALRNDDLSGKLSKASAGFADLKENVGLFIYELKPLEALLSAINRGFEQYAILKPVEVRRTGTGETISGYDELRFIAEKQASNREAFLGGVNNYLLPGLALGAGALGLGLFGRNQARQSVVTRTYGEQYQLATASGLNANAAASQAQLLASQAKPGISRSVEAGMSRLTVGLTGSITGLMDTAYRSVFTQTQAAQAQLMRSQRITGPNRQYTPFLPTGLQSPVTVAQSQQTANRIATGGGLLGAGAGFTIGSMIAERMQAGTITATALTVLGGIGGDALGTAIGSAIGPALAAKGLTFGPLALASGGAVLAGLGINSYVNQAYGYPEQRLQRENIASGVYGKQQSERLQAEREGRLGYYLNVPGSNLKRFSPEEVRQLYSSGNYSAADFKTLFREAIASTETQGTAFDKALAVVGEQFSKGTTASSDAYRADRAIREEKARQEKDSKIQERINQQSTALQKLRDTAIGSFRLVTEIGQGLAIDNPFVQVFSDAETVAMRMREQWSFLGEDAVEYFSKMERGKILFQEMKLDLDALARSQKLLGQAARERDEREAPGLTTRQQNAQSILQSELGRINERFDFRRQRAATFGGSLGFNADYYLDDRGVIDQLRAIDNAGLFGYGIGGDSPEVLAEVARAKRGILSNLDPRTIRRSQYLTDQFSQVDRTLEGYSTTKVRDELTKLRISDREQQRIDEDIRQYELKASTYRDEQQARGARRELDRFIVSRTDGIPIKDLTATQFEQRQSALRREAEATIREKEEAKAAVAQGLAYQKSILSEMVKLRAAIIGGDVSVLVQVLNDTQARIDQEALQDANGINYDVPLRGKSTINPYSGLNDRYGRGGRTR